MQLVVGNQLAKICSHGLSTQHLEFATNRSSAIQHDSGTVEIVLGLWMSMAADAQPALAGDAGLCWTVAPADGVMPARVPHVDFEEAPPSSLARACENST
jgi:hypothetical protein